MMFRFLAAAAAAAFCRLGSAAPAPFSAPPLGAGLATGLALTALLFAAAAARFRRCFLVRSFWADGLAVVGFGV